MNISHKSKIIIEFLLILCLNYSFLWIQYSKPIESQTLPKHQMNIPSGLIIMYYGNITNIPNGWLLCDGTEGTPNFTSRFVRSVNDGENPGEIGGINSHNHYYTQIPNHTHTLDYDGEHSHIIPITGTGTTLGLYSIATGLYYKDLIFSLNNSHNHTIKAKGNFSGFTSNSDNRPPFYSIYFLKAGSNVTCIPAQSILLWSKSVLELPSEWYACDGTFDTPNLSHRFLMGADIGQSPQIFGGSEFHDHSYTTLINHTHTTNISGSHSHTYPILNGIGSCEGAVIEKGYGIENGIITDPNGNHSHGMNQTGDENPKTESGSSLPPYMDLIYITNRNNSVLKFPKQAIAIWANNLDLISSEWIYCNGSKSTPNLSGKFIRGVQNKEELGNVGGTINHFHYYNDIPLHNHNVELSGQHQHESTSVVFYGGMVYECASNLGNPTTIETTLDGSHIHNIGYTGKELCTTNSINNYPAYYKVAFIMYQNSAPTSLNLIINPTNPTTIDNLEIYYDYYDADQDPMAIREICWYRDEQLQYQYNNSTFIPHEYTNKSSEWKVMIRVNDGYIYGDWLESNHVSIQNSLPIISNTRIVPESQKDDDDIELFFDLSDYDGDTISTQIRWYRNEIIQPQMNNSLLLSRNMTSDQDKWNITIIPNDGESNGNTYRFSFFIGILIEPLETINNTSITSSSDPTTDTTPSSQNASEKINSPSWGLILFGIVGIGIYLVKKTRKKSILLIP